MSLIFGVILGFEREAKDKSAGLRTITLITVGSTLFSILSQNFSGDGDSFAIAAGIISGIGFLGAGVIYEEGFSIYGLTTAGVIWVYSAIGMAIGFGEFYIGTVFLIFTLMIIYLLQYFGNVFIPNNNSRLLSMEISKNHLSQRKQILEALEVFTDYQRVNKTEKRESGNLCIGLDIQVKATQIEELEDFLLNNEYIYTYSL